MASKYILQYKHVPFWNIGTNKTVKYICVIKTKLLLHFKCKHNDIFDRDGTYNNVTQTYIVISLR
jgi:hypothetical protein